MFVSAEFEEASIIRSCATDFTGCGTLDTEGHVPTGEIKRMDDGY